MLASTYLLLICHCEKKYGYSYPLTVQNERGCILTMNKVQAGVFAICVSKFFSREAKFLIRALASAQAAAG